MKTESLHALIIDHHLGELSPEAAELLEHHLAANAQARAEAERILQSLDATREAVLRHTELAQVPAAAPHTPLIVKKAAPTPWMARAAAVALLAGGGGFFAGRSHTPTAPDAMVENASKPRQQSPWAQYRMSFDPAGSGVQVVRVDTDKLQNKSLR